MEKEFAKIVVVFALYVIMPVILGAVASTSRNLQRLIFFVTCFMTIGGFFGPKEWGVTLQMLAGNYRGHAQGYHFFINEGLALTLIVSQLVRNFRDFKVMPPGLWLYYVYCGLSMLSLFTAFVPEYGWMAAVKAVKAPVFYIAAYNFFREEKDLHFFLGCMAITIAWELFAVLKLKYISHMYQVKGTFEHQNSLTMYAGLLGMMFLATGMTSTGLKGWLYLFAYVCSAVVVQSTLSRGGLVVFAAGSVGVTLFSLYDKITMRRIVSMGALALVGLVGLAVSLDTIIERFNQRGNEESAMTRKLLNEASREMVQDHPLGVGWNNFVVAINPPHRYGDIVDEHTLERGHRLRDPDLYQKGLVESQYYLILAESGYHALAWYILLLIVFLWWNLRGIRHYRGTTLGALSIGIAGGCAANYIQSTLEHVLVQPRNLALWLMVLAATARIESWRRQDVRAKAAARTSSPTAAPAPAPLLGAPQWSRGGPL